MSSATVEVDRLAGRILAASDAVRSIPPLTGELPELSLADAYAISAAVRARRVARGEHPVGWKIGFTNRTIWDEYGVHAPIWGRVYDTTLVAADPGTITACATDRLVEPRIEPEIVFRFARTPEPGMDEAALLTCIDGVGHGFEIVQSLYPGWRFKAPDTVAAFGLHGRLFAGPFAPVAAADWLTLLPEAEVTLSRDGEKIDRETAASVLGGPLSALRHFVAGLDRMSGERVAPGEVVTTGTVTRAFPIHPGEVWSSAIAGVPLRGLTLAVA